ncbi:MAG TPA: YibE/F family protein [Actinomycetota bacterium]|nr:YibE/F family protein [Actinomycetota bacterium]
MDASGNRQRLLLAVVGVLVLAVLAGAVALWPRGRLAEPAGGGQADPTRLVPATLTSVQTVPCQEAEPGLPGSTCIKVRARPDGAEEVEFDTTDPTGDTFRSGQRVRLSILEQAGQPTFYNIRDLERGRPMVALAALFVLAVIAFGRWQGVRSLIGLACSFAVIVGFVVPAILRGQSPVPVALVGAMAIMLASLYLSYGVGRKTTAAVVGTALAIGLTGALTAGFVELTALTGLASEEALNASFQVGGISLQGLLLAGIILGGLGVLDDVTVSQASLVFELRRADPAAGFAELTRGALAVGRDHVAASVNTLFLAYAGASLPLLVLFVSGGDPLGTVVTAEAVAVEVVRTLCGSVGLIAAVPLTTVLAANLALEEPAAGPGGPGDRRGGHPVDRGGPATPAGDGRVRYSPARGLDAASAGALFGQVLGLHGPALSEAVVGVAPGDSVAVEALPEGARQAAGQLRRLAAGARREGTSSWYRRAREAGTVRLDPADPGQLELLRRFGAFSTDTRVWVEGDPEPVVETTDSFDGLPRVTYRLDAGELDNLRATLARGGLAGATLTPRRSRAHRH